MSPKNRDKRALITGVTGQDGAYLAAQLLEAGYRVWGMVRRASTANTNRLEYLLGDIEGGALELVYGDLGDGPSIHRLLTEIRPDEVYNLAAQSHVKISFDVPEYTADVTGVGPVRLLEGLRQLCPEARFYQASSSEMFGKVSESPQNEETPFHPRSPYAAAKVFAFHLTRNYREAYGMFAVNGILFNHESPLRGDDFVTRKITRAVSRIFAGGQDCLYLGNLDARRDWGFAGDYVDAMWRMLQAEDPRDYVIATGDTHTVREFCDRAFARVGLPLEWRGEGLNEVGIDADGRRLVRVDERFFRPAEVDLLLGDASLAQRDLGWEPKVHFNELVDMMVEADLKAIGADVPAFA